MLIKRTLIVVLSCSVVFSIGPLLYGQANGSFLGTVSDKTGSVISGATVTVTSQGTGLSRETKTDDTGHYLTPLLPVGNYTIRVNSQGFKTVEQTDIRLQVNEQREVDFTLVPGSVTEAAEGRPATRAGGEPPPPPPRGNTTPPDRRPPCTAPAAPAGQHPHADTKRQSATHN